MPRRGDGELQPGQIQTHQRAPIVSGLRLPFFFFMFRMSPCIRHHATGFVCLFLVGCEKRQRLGESCRETLQGLERMLIKASYSTASSFLTVPAAGSTTLCFLTTSSPLSLSALLYFCLLLLLSPSLSVSFPICVSPASFSLGPPPAIWKLK